MAIPLCELPQGNPVCNELTTNWAIREMENWLVGPRTKARRAALGGGRRQFALHTADGQNPGIQAVAQGAG